MSRWVNVSKNTGRLRPPLLIHEQPDLGGFCHTLKGPALFYLRTSINVAFNNGMK